jgi:predicted aconitase
MTESDLGDVERMQSRLTKEHRRLGIIPTYTCHPHFQHELRLGEHVAFTESNVQIFANAWFGARSNIEGASTAIAAAITGRTPEYGLHIEGNRRGEIVIEVNEETQPESFDYADYGALSFWTGKLLTNHIPIYLGLSEKMTAGQAKYMCAPQILHSSAATFHIVGVTPEARSLEEALGGARAKGRARFGKRERREAFESLCSAKDQNVDLVCLGCPHCTLDELAAIAGLLEGKKVNGQTRLWIGTNEPTRNLAERMGIIALIEEAGGLVLTGMCSGTAPILRLGRKLGIRTVASNSACLAGILCRSGRGKFGAWFGRTSDCIAAAINGKWEGG